MLCFSLLFFLFLSSIQPAFLDPDTLASPVLCSLHRSPSGAAWRAAPVDLPSRCQPGAAVNPLLTMQNIYQEYISCFKQAHKVNLAETGHGTNSFSKNCFKFPFHKKKERSKKTNWQIALLIRKQLKFMVNGFV